MIFDETPIPGAFVVTPERREDARGFFARVWCRHEFEARGLVTAHDQSSLSFNHRRGTLRGMHYQRDPHPETKLVRCTRGHVYDVIVDLRPDSPAYLKWFATELSDDNLRMLYVPPLVAHGFQTLTADCELSYQISGEYQPESAAGVRWNDPTISIDWPLDVTVIAPRDAAWADRSRALAPVSPAQLRTADSPELFIGTCPGQEKGAA